jgi:hypothetical protein
MQTGSFWIGITPFWAVETVVNIHHGQGGAALLARFVGGGRGRFGAADDCVGYRSHG